MLFSVRHNISNLRKPNGFYDLLKTIGEQSKSKKHNAKSSEYAGFLLTMPATFYKLPDRPTNVGSRISQLLRKTYG